MNSLSREDTEWIHYWVNHKNQLTITAEIFVKKKRHMKLSPTPELWWKQHKSCILKVASYYYYYYYYYYFFFFFFFSSSSWVHKMWKSTSTCKKPGQRQKLSSPKTQSFLHKSLNSFLWMGGCNSGSLSGFWVGGWIFFLIFFNF